MSDQPEIPDLRAMLAEASRPSSSVTVPLKQGLRQRIEQAEAELEGLASSGKSQRMGARSPLAAKAEEIEALRAEMAASSLTFHFEAITSAQRDQIRKDMDGRDNPDEINLRVIAAMCSRIVGPDGSEYPTRMEWTDFRDLRDRIGVGVFEQTIDAATDRAAGAQWSVPFSSAASHILGTET